MIVHYISLENIYEWTGSVVGLFPIVLCCKPLVVCLPSPCPSLLLRAYSYRTSEEKSLTDKRNTFLVWILPRYTATVGMHRGTQR